MTDTGPPAAVVAETAALAAAAAVGEPTGTVALPAASTTFLAVPTTETHDMVYCCRKCRLPLFRPEQIGSHAASKHTFSHHRTVKEREKSRSTEHEQECTSFFLEEPVQWMKVRDRHRCRRCAIREIVRRFGDSADHSIVRACRMRPQTWRAS
jgi:hypothetical protein